MLLMFRVSIKQMLINHVTWETTQKHETF